MNLSTHLNTEQLEQGNIADSEYQLQLNLNQEEIGQKFTKNYLLGNQSRTGDAAESFFIFDAMRRGAEVFANNSCVGEADAVIKVKEQLYEINVKMAGWYYNINVNGDKIGYWKSEGSHKIFYPVWPVQVEPWANGIWRCRWAGVRGRPGKEGRKYRCPAGLEDFWDKDWKMILQKSGQLND